MRSIEQMKLGNKLTVGALTDIMGECGVLGAGRIGKAVEIAYKMFKDSDCEVFLTLAGPLVPGGLRRIISDSIKKGFVDVLVTTGANMVHDMIEALGHRHYVGSFFAKDRDLLEEDLGRIGDIYVKHEAFRDLEKWIIAIIDEMNREEPISIAEFLKEIGRHIDDENSVIAVASNREVPIISPGFLDSIAGFQVWTAWQDKKIRFDPFLDLSIIVDRVFEAKRSGIIVLGGGLPKHFGLFANTFRGGVDYAIQITMDRPEPGGLSGASLEEAISWRKITPEGEAVTVICDATIAFPLIMAAANEKMAKSQSES